MICKWANEGNHFKIKSINIPDTDSPNIPKSEVRKLFRLTEPYELKKSYAERE